MIECHIQLGMAFGFRILLAEGHGAKTDLTDHDASATKFTLLHVKTCLGLVGRGAGRLCQARVLQKTDGNAITPGQAGIRQ
ncbi:hypothetical protein AA0616_0744 [Komagataeibacter nataicola NRIC 0616]|nr:hypothetical protein AA0616_0744 [Komagataeibacter nataicola NRIC 0616]